MIDKKDDMSARFRYTHGLPPETLFPTPITVTSDGPVTLPPYDQHDEDGQ